jgi:tRNA-2-methylthio-N6-dimethylallyladenosine synthase
VSARDPIRPEAAAGSYFVETWGCQMNELDAEKMSGALERKGYVRVPRPDQADVVLLNTCSIREKAEEKVYSELGRLLPLKRDRPGMVLAVCGCVAQREGERVFARAPHVDLVIGTRATGSLPILVERLRAGDEGARHTSDTELRDDSIHFPFEEIRRAGIGAGQAYVTVIEGCNHRCTFCVVPQTRGREISRDLDDVVRETRALAERGVVEIEFLGQTVNAYRDPDGRDLADLLDAASRVDGIARIRFTTSHPAQMTERLMDAMARSDAVCPYLHLPVQSGSSRVLHDMRRGYDRAAYLSRVRSLRARTPEISLGTDVIVGFPTETDEDFRATLDLLEEVEFDTVYSFTYSERPGTAAEARRDPVPAPVKLERLSRLHEAQRRIQERRYRRFVGRSVEVLVEGPSKRDPSQWTGRTRDARIVNFFGTSAPGRLETLEITGSTAFSLRGRLAQGRA